MKAKRIRLHASAVGTTTDLLRGCSMFVSAPPAGSGVQDTAPRPARQAPSSQWEAGAATSLPPERDSLGDRGGRTAGRPAQRVAGGAALKDLATPLSSRRALSSGVPLLSKTERRVREFRGKPFGSGAERGCLLPASHGGRSRRWGGV